MRKRGGYLLSIVLGVSCLLFLSGLVLTRMVMTDRLVFVKYSLQLDCQRQAIQALQKELAARIAEAPTGISQEPIELAARREKQSYFSEIHATVSLGKPVLEDDFSFLSLELDLNPSEISVTLDALGHLIIQNKIGGDAHVLFGSQDWRNMSFTSNLTLNQGTGVGVWIRASREQGGMSGYLMQYQLLDDTLRGGTFSIDRYENGVRERLTSRTGQSLGLGGLSWLLGLQHRITAGADQKLIWFEIDGKRLLEVNDENPLTGGRVGYSSGLAGLMLLNNTIVESTPEIRAIWKNR